MRPSAPIKMKVGGPIHVFKKGETPATASDEAHRLHIALSAGGYVLRPDVQDAAHIAAKSA